MCPLSLLPSYSQSTRPVSLLSLYSTSFVTLFSATAFKGRYSSEWACNTTFWMRSDETSPGAHSHIPIVCCDPNQLRDNLTAMLQQIALPFALVPPRPDSMFLSFVSKCLLHDGWAGLQHCVLQVLEKWFVASSHRPVFINALISKRIHILVTNVYTNTKLYTV